MYGKSNTGTYITICKIDRQWEFALWLRKLKQGLCINLEGWDEEGSSGRRGYMNTYGWFMLRFDRKQKNSVKQLSFNKKIKKIGVFFFFKVSYNQVHPYLTEVWNKKFIVSVIRNCIMTMWGGVFRLLVESVADTISPLFPQWPHL